LVSIYVLRCDVCEKNKPVAECRLPGGLTLRVCAACYALLEGAERFCPGAWSLKGIKKREELKREKLKEIEELLEMLE